MIAGNKETAHVARIFKVVQETQRDFIIIGHVTGNNHGFDLMFLHRCNQSRQNPAGFVIFEIDMQVG